MSVITLIRDKTSETINMASDGRWLRGDNIVQDDHQKIHPLLVGNVVRYLIGMTGDCDLVARLLNQLHSCPLKSDLMHPFSLAKYMIEFYNSMSFSISENGLDFIIVHILNESANKVFAGLRESCFEVNRPFFAIGSGAPFAIGALHKGATVKEAVEIACLHDCNCGGKISEVTLNKGGLKQ